MIAGRIRRVFRGPEILERLDQGPVRVVAQVAGPEQVRDQTSQVARRGIPGAVLLEPLLQPLFQLQGQASGFTPLAHGVTQVPGLVQGGQDAGVGLP